MDFILAVIIIINKYVAYYIKLYIATYRDKP